MIKYNPVEKENPFRPNFIADQEFEKSFKLYSQSLKLRLGNERRD